MTKKYDVYGVGNALVDFEFEVHTDTLNHLKIEKGLMTLVDEERQTEILSHVGKSNHKRSCGGSAANTMIALAQFGGNAFYSCKVANDEAGLFYYEDLRANGVNTNLHPNTLLNGTTGKCLVLVTPDSDRTMNTYLGITAEFSTRELMEEEIIKAKYVYLEGYLVPNPEAVKACLNAKKIAREHGIKVAMTFSDVNMINYFGAQMTELLDGGIDFLFANEAEAYAYTKTNDLADCVKAMKKIAKQFAITLGPKGAIVFDGETETRIETIAVNAVDSNGAGDLFAGAVLYGLTNGMNLVDAAKMGCLSSSTLVTQFGARLRSEQVLNIKKTFVK